MAVGIVSLQQAARAAFSTGPSAPPGKGFAQALDQAVATTGTTAQPPRHAVVGVDIGGAHAHHGKTAAEDSLTGSLEQTLQAGLSGSTLPPG